MNGAGSPAVELSIIETAFGGKGVARLDGKVCFLPGVLPGEHVRAAIVRDRKDFCEAVPLAILDPSPHRSVPACPLSLSCPVSNLKSPILTPENAAACPGCAYQHVAYEHEILLKQNQLKAFLARNAGADPGLTLAPVPSPLPLGYRNKMALHAQRDGKETRFGYFTEDNTTVVDVPACPLAAPPLNALLAELRAKPGFLGGLRDGMTVTFRWTERDGAVWWRGRASEKDTWLVETSPSGPFSVPRNSFYQVNPPVANLLVERVAGLIEAQQPVTAIDLFCGIGVFAIAAARRGVPSVIGVDADEAAIEAARYNARQHGTGNVEWIPATARRAIARLRERPKSDRTTLILDPPRTGIGHDLIGDILRLAPAHILYVSCAADTLCRDLKDFKTAGYSVRHAQLFDMFPRTPHFESLTELARG